jgi:hypothetical protein
MQARPCRISLVSLIDQMYHRTMVVRKSRVYRPYPTDEQERSLGQSVGAVDAAHNILRQAHSPVPPVRGDRATQPVEAGSRRRVA